jgi:hypothetical protein
MGLTVEKSDARSRRKGPEVRSIANGFGSGAGFAATWRSPAKETGQFRVNALWAEGLAKITILQFPDAEQFNRQPAPD